MWLAQHQASPLFPSASGVTAKQQHAPPTPDLGVHRGPPHRLAPLSSRAECAPSVGSRRPSRQRCGWRRGPGPGLPSLWVPGLWRPLPCCPLWSLQEGWGRRPSPSRPLPTACRHPAWRESTGPRLARCAMLTAAPGHPPGPLGPPPAPALAPSPPCCSRCCCPRRCPRRCPRCWSSTARCGGAAAGPGPASAASVGRGCLEASAVPSGRDSRQGSACGTGSASPPTALGRLAARRAGALPALGHWEKSHRSQKPDAPPPPPARLPRRWPSGDSRRRLTLTMTFHLLRHWEPDRWGSSDAIFAQ